jgi:hypothetical protein
MKHRLVTSLCLIALLSVLLACSVDIELTPTPNPDGSPGTGNQPPSAATQPPAEAPLAQTGDILFFPVLPVEVVPTEGALKVLHAAAMKTMSNWEIFAVVRNDSSSTLDVYTEYNWTIEVLDKNGSVIGTNTGTDTAGLPPGQIAAVRGQPGTWEGEADRFRFTFTPVVRFIQDDMKPVFNALSLPSPLFETTATPFTIAESEFFGSKVLTAKSTVTIHNPNVGPSEVSTIAVYYDASGNIVSLATWRSNQIEGNSDITFEMETLPYLGGQPARVEYFTYMLDAYFMEELLNMW